MPLWCYVAQMKAQPSVFFFLAGSKWRLHRIKSQWMAKLCHLFSNSFKMSQTVPRVTSYPFKCEQKYFDGFSKICVLCCLEDNSAQPGNIRWQINEKEEESYSDNTRLQLSLKMAIGSYASFYRFIWFLSDDTRQLGMGARRAGEPGINGLISWWKFIPLIQEKKYTTSWLV